MEILPGLLGCCVGGLGRATEAITLSLRYFVAVSVQVGGAVCGRVRVLCTEHARVRRADVGCGFQADIIELRSAACNSYRSGREFLGLVWVTMWAD